ncbi:hypothetical protein Vadar_005038 [Vaccinium darrowii]|uniref:Uncharacterized protein n=1 Tax=Vaccinium darrowii TaxID=229202 RepID=A0ACB7ZAI6_9ERIC|nr:hypothetical protein Vadar_005038 [Vaccinium darrowii]
MGSSEGMTPPKPEVASPPKQDYYVPGVLISPSYQNSAIMAGHAPDHHAWAQPQPVVPYLTIFSPEVIYAYPTVPLLRLDAIFQSILPNVHDSHLSCIPVPDVLTFEYNQCSVFSNISYDSMDQGIAKMLDRLDRVDMQIVNDTTDVNGEGSINGASQSAEGGIDSSSNRSDSHTGKAFKGDTAFYGQSSGMDRSLYVSVDDHDVEDHNQANSTVEGDANVVSINLTEITVAPENVAENLVDTSNGKLETRMTRSASCVAAGLPLQAEVEELMKRYETAKVQNITLKSDIRQLTEELEKLKDENVALMKLDGTRVTHPREMVLGEIRPDSSTQPDCSEHGFMLNNSVSFVNGINERECQTLANNDSEMKLHKSESRVDAVATC